MPGPLETGRPSPRHDALAKACGAEKYAIDHYPEGLVWAGAKRAGTGPARLLAVAAGEALALPGVLAVLTARDVTGSNRQGIVHKDQPVLAEDLVRHPGEAVALVLAEDRRTLARALDLIRMDLSPLPGVFDPVEALKPGAPQVHPGRPGGNLLLRAEIRTGRGAKALKDCDVVVRGTFHTPVQEHAFLEAPNGLAQLLPDGTLHLTASTQAPFRDRFEIGHALGLDPSRIRVTAPHLGGGFGGKDGATVQCLLALAALHAGGRPVKMVWSREETFTAGYKRHAAVMRCALGARADGTLTALACRLHFDTGAYAHLGGEVMELGMEHAAGPYRVPEVFIEGFCVYTNNPVAGAMRGFGAAQTSFAAESLMDALAARLGLDPLELRLKNALRRGDVNPAGVVLTTSTGMAECLEAVAGHPLWRDREAWKRKAPPFVRRGVGVCAVSNAVGYGRGLPDSAIAKIELTPEGRFRIYSGVADMGQGNSSAFVQLAGDALCQEAAAFDLVQPDTELCLPSGSSAAGRTTYTYGKALLEACRTMRDKLFHRSALVLMADRLEDFALLPGRVRHLPTGREVPLALLAGFLPAEDRICTAQAVMPVAPDATGTGKDFLIGYPHLLFSYAAQVLAVEADELTGRVRIVRAVSATDGGRVINPQSFAQQVQGAMVQGAGFALSEEVATEAGRILNPDFTTYLIPTALDAPEVTVLAAPTFEDTGPGGMKGVGEVNLNGVLPATAAAVRDACGARIARGPLTPERVLAALKKRRRKP